MCSPEHNKKGIFLQNMVANFVAQVLYVFKCKYKYYVNSVLEMKNELLGMD